MDYCSVDVKRNIIPPARDFYDVGNLILVKVLLVYYYQLWMFIGVGVIIGTHEYAAVISYLTLQPDDKPIIGIGIHHRGNHSGNVYINILKRLAGMWYQHLCSSGAGRLIEPGNCTGTPAGGCLLNIK